MIYITTDENQRVEFTHYKPFDEKYGLHKTDAELLETGYLVESVPTLYEGNVPEGHRAVLCYDGSDFYWKLEVEEVVDETAQLKAQIAELQEAYNILTGGVVNE